MAKETVASLSAKLDTLISALGGEQPQAQEAAPQAQETQAKVATVTRNLDPEEVTINGRDYIVLSAGPSGVFRTARIKPIKGRNKSTGAPTFAMSLSVEDVRAIADNGEDLLAACDRVERAAKIGQHAPAK